MNEHLWISKLFGSEVVVTPWKLIGVIGALMFASRWFVQAYYSRRAGRSVTPRLFWVMSIVGSITTLAYFVFNPKHDMVGVLQNLFPFFIASYNLYLDIRNEKREIAERLAAMTPRPQVHAPINAVPINATSMAETVAD